MAEGGGAGAGTAPGGSGAPAGQPRQPRRGPAPIASFDHDHDHDPSDEVRTLSSPETKQPTRLPEIREDRSPGASADGLCPPEQRARSASTPGALQAPPAPRIDISRASSSSHHDSRDSSPELALFAGSASGSGAGAELGFREDGALDLRSSTEELAFLEPAPAPPPSGPPPARRHSRKDSQGSEAALLAVSGRTSRLSSVGSQCSAHSALSAFSRTSHVSRLSVASGASRSPSPHRMLLETSFCGPKPIETDPEICTAAVEERLMEMAKMNAADRELTPSISTVAVPVVVTAPPPLDARDRREVRTEATVENAAPRPPAARPPPADAEPATVAPAPAVAPAQLTCDPAPPAVDPEKKQKEKKNRARAEERQARSRERRDPSDRRAKSQTKDIIRIRLKPSEEYDDDDVDDEEDDRAQAVGVAAKPITLALNERAPRSADLASEAAPQRRPTRDSRTPSPTGAVVSRKSSFCSLFKSRETIASPESPSDALRRKKSATDGRSRSRSRDRSTTPTSATKIRGSVLSLFRTPRKSATSPSPSSRDGSPVVQQTRQLAPPADRPRRGERLKYYEDTAEGIIHIPLRTPPEEAGASRLSDPERRPSAPEPRINELEPRPASAPHARALHTPPVSSAGPAPTPCTSTPAVSTVAGERPKSIRRTVLPDGSIIIPLRSPTERTPPEEILPPAPPPRSPEASRSIDSAPRPSSGAATTSVERSTSSETSPVPAETARPEPALAENAPNGERPRRRERIVFATHVGSRDQLFSTQLSITKTPSVTSEISGSLPSFPETEEARGGTASPPETRESRESSGSEASSEAGGATGSGEGSAGGAGSARACSDAEARGLVVQESFEEELPYVPTTLPQERPRALPMLPVRERAAAALRVAPLQRPRPPHVPRSAPPPVPGPVPLPQATQLAQSWSSTGVGGAGAAEGDKLRIKLPRRPRTGSASAPPRPERPRTRSGSDGMETRPKTEWIDFSEVPERRKQPTRIQTLPAGAAATGSRDVVFNYVAPEHCRCECHARDPHLQGSGESCEEHAGDS
ncbi:unnamed protein product [Chilo suppressalis]|uniref:Uncharacterized protein n=1 Tax=Chilo suppressalis TaxID=168631 RepID=A0ABN8L2N1_CHISP|nr:unnamed protein product [Chilo suppressalis]